MPNKFGAFIQISKTYAIYMNQLFFAYEMPKTKEIFLSRISIENCVSVMANVESGLELRVNSTLAPKFEDRVESTQL